MKIAPWLVAAALLAGCTTIDLGRSYTRRDAGVVQASWDEWQCRRQVEETVQTPDLLIGGVADAVRIAIETEMRDLKLGRCMQERGYQPSREGGWSGFTRDVWSRM